MANWSAQDLGNLCMRRYNYDGNLEADSTILKLAPMVFNGRPVWEMDYHHAICFTPSKEPSADGRDGFWAIANLTNASEVSRGEACAFCLDRPRAMETPGSPYPPMGIWIRGRPWLRDMCFPRDKPQFSLERVGGSEYGA